MKQSISTSPATPAPATAPGIPAGLRGYLYLTSAITGAAVLIVEILGAKMLSPYVGTSHFVWTAQIAVTLVSLAFGYYLGGRMADKSPALSRMYYCILAASIYLCLTVPLCRPVAYACLNFRLAVGSLLASAFLFFPPLTLLATVGPFLVRNFTQSVSAVGGQVGRLSALSTLGSVAGTLLIGYVLIPYLPNSITMYFTASVLMLVALVYFFRQGRQASKSAAIVSSLLALAGLGGGFYGVRADAHFAPPSFEVLERCNSNFGEMIVLQHTNHLQRHYLNDYLVQNTYDPAQHKSLSMFTYMLHGLARAYTPKIENALCIGLGVGIAPMALAEEGVKVDVAEINPTVVGIAQRHFGLEPAKLNINICDGRQFLNTCPASRYDTILLDAFLGDSSPSHLMTREAFEAMRKVLKPNGTLVINSFGDLEPGKDFFTASLQVTLQSVFKNVRIHTATYGNVMFVAGDRPEFKFVHEPNLASVHPAALAQTQEAFAKIVEAIPSHGRILTDDFNPVEFYDAGNRETTRRYLAFRVRANGSQEED